MTVNFESAFGWLRRIDNDLITLWVNALCINQSNISERTEQVNLMRDILSYTEEVILYLEEAPESGSMALNESISTLITTFTCDESDKENLDIFLRRCKAKNASTVLKGKAGIDYEFDIFCFLRLFAGKSDANDLPAFGANSGQFIGTDCCVNKHAPWRNYRAINDSNIH